MEISLEKFLDCPCTRFEPMKASGLLANGTQTIMKSYRAARVRGAKEGFIPLLLPAKDENFLESLTWEEYNPPEEFRRKMLEGPVLDGKAFLTRQHEDAFDDPGYMDEITGPMEGGEASDEFIGILDYGRPRKTIPLLLAEIPVKNPWEVFAWIPFGSWNACPAPEEHMAAAKYWYEKYGAAPAVMTMDVLEFSVPAPVKREEAMALAWEQTAYCPDIVEQGCGTVGRLADCLAKSTTWFFWWD